jgi:outer membrane protein
MRLLYFFPIWSLIICPLFSQEINKITLEEAYRTAFKKTEILQLEESRRKQANARVDQASSVFFPNISAKANYLREGGNSVSGDNTVFAVSVTQPIYQGGRDRALLAAAQSDKLAKEYSFTALRVETYSAVAAAYYQILAAQLDIENLKSTLLQTRGIIDELKKRNAIGQTKNSEVLMTEAQLAVDQADLKAAEGRLNAAREQFAFTTGLDKNTGVVNNTKMHPEIEPLAYYLSYADKRPDILFLTSNVTTAKENLAKEKRGYRPSVSLLADWYPVQSDSSSPRWDLGVGLSVPVFDGSNIKARIREAQGKVEEAEAILKKQKRQSEADIKAAYENVVNLRDQVNALVSALSATEKNYNEQKKDYEFSLVTNLDVLQALNTFQSTKRNLDKTKVDMLSAFAQLMAAVAQIPE